MDWQPIYETCKAIKIPACCFQKYDGIKENINIESYHQLLQKFGLMIVSIPENDSDGKHIETLVKTIGMPYCYGNTKDILWHVKLGGKNRTEHLARSHSLEEFSVHTDCSFEMITPEFIGLQIVQHDRLGGGKNIIIDGYNLIQNLTKTTFNILSEEKIIIKVPLEFKKEKDTIQATILDKDLNIRYRDDIIGDANNKSEALETALNEFKQLACLPELNRSLEMTKNNILLLDNRRYLHARTMIKDSERHLIRAWFSLKKDVKH